MIILLLLLVIVLASYALTGRILRYCISKNIVDPQSARSSHTGSMPRGGGIGFSGLFLCAILALGAYGAMPPRPAIAIAGGGLLVILTGWSDDRKPLSPRVRMILHLVAAAWAVAWIGPVPPFSVGSISWNWGWLGSVVTIIAIAWMLNLYNFMDGTDGIASVEAVTVALMAGVLCVTAGSPAIGHVYWLLGSAVTGFLIWNWPPARIFMGDAGSGFLGFAFGALIFWGAVENSRLFWPCAILLSVFFADATTTLLLRMIGREKWYEPHSSHAYQRLARRWKHQPVALGVAAINLFVLAPGSWLAWRYPELGLPLALILNGALAAAILIVRKRLP